MPVPYIGVCDVTSAKQATVLAQVMRTHSDSMSRRRLMAGVMMSRKTLHGIESKWAAVWPPKERLPEIFAPQPWCINTLHYADYEGIDVPLNLVRAAHHCGPNLDAIQLDMVWPDPDDIYLFADARQDLKLVLQVNSRAMDECGNSPKQVADRLEEYAGALDYVLLDKSMGRGTGLDAAGLLPYLYAIAEQMPDLGLAVAGGLGPDTLDLVEPIVEEFPEVSIDAQSKLHVGGESLALIDDGRAVLYVRNAAYMFQKFGT